MDCPYGQTTIYKVLKRKFKIEQQKHHEKTRVNSGTQEQ
jgi:hypothetical protein